ncbi:BNR-4 repeat-containing protein [Flammeovirga pacifica]|uniref:CBM6 domain-containing protein n=1 Tax=Flammeovirga pacifica TaxID=915059 RepID=A0A1S1YUN8_FLAPC|nr:BNR-4 repeat-containing protein [Flammeovirga pacifica]OHX64515.1 hypothetical protein NH26_23350 [Flammeovirga pacifica]
MKEKLLFQGFNSLTKHHLLFTSLFIFGVAIFQNTNAQVSFELEQMVSDKIMYFDGNKVDLNHTANNPSGYDYVYGRALTPHGDCIKVYQNFVFMTWYRGGKEDRHVMLTRYNMTTGVSKTIEFPHQHTGYNGKWWIGETHNTISVGICPKDNTVHMLYDLHRNGNIAKDNIGTEDYLRYSYTEEGAAIVPDDEFTLERFVNSEKGNYKHLSFKGIDNITVTKLLTYPAFFTNDEGDLFMKNRFGYSENGRFLFARYDGNEWHGYTDFNRSGATNYGSEYNWGLYGDIKYVNGKIRIGFQRRSNNRTDKYQYQNGIYYAYSDDPKGLSEWKDYTGTGFSRPLADADLIKVSEPGDWVETTQKDKVHIVSGFDWTVTEQGDVHFVSTVKDKENNVTKKLHTYKKNADSEFTTVEYTAGSELYTSGDDVYVIGLKSGRVNIVKTKGGASEFETVYQHTTGPIFDKGVANVYDGKVYYFLKESGGTGDERTAYLQVFDLGISDIKVTVTSPTENSTHLLGETVAVNAEITSTNEIKEVNFSVNGQALSTITSAPYTIDWTPDALGEYSIEVEAVDILDEKSSVAKVNVEVADPKSVLIFKDLTDNTEVPTGSDLDLTAIVGTDFTEVALMVNDVNVGTLTTAPFVWSSASIPALSNLTDFEYQLKLVAKNVAEEVTEKAITVLTPKPEQWPYTEDNQPHAIPGKIEFEHYDNGGIDIAYWDKINQNSSSFRPDEMVDISSDGTKVRDIKTGEWLEYTIEIAESGDYELIVNHQSRRVPDVEQLTVSFFDEDITFISNKVLTHTGSSSFISENIGTFYMEAGVHVLRFSFLEFGWDVDFFELNKVESEFEVTFKTEENTIVKSVKDDGTCDLPTPPTKEGYYFKEWVTATGEVFDETTIVTENMEVVATWTKKFTITTQFDEDQGEVTYTENDAFEYTFTATAKEGFEFEAWSGDYEGTENPLTITIDDDFNLQATFKAVNAPVTSINNLQSSSKVYPNPSNGLFKIELLTAQNAEYKVYSMTGRLVSQGHFYHKTSLEIPNKTNNIYFLEIITSSGVETKKLLIK